MVGQVGKLSNDRHLCMLGKKQTKVGFLNLVHKILNIGPSLFSCQNLAYM